MALIRTYLLQFASLHFLCTILFVRSEGNHRQNAHSTEKREGGDRGKEKREAESVNIASERDKDRRIFIIVSFQRIKNAVFEGALVLCDMYYYSCLKYNMNAEREQLKQQSE